VHSRLAITLAVLLLVPGATLFASAADAPTVASVSQGLTCQCGCGLTVANCNHPTCSFSVPIRGEIESMITKGKTGPQIIGFYREKFGEKVLSAPTTEGFNVLAWLMPFIAIGIGGALIVLMASRWRSARTPVQTAIAPHEPAYDPELRHRLDADIRERS
jgi:cytochrome c-type biogenesis protein CcmH